ncbi:uncharacterized protein METZ01_LOCUS453930, partial [marine metagenome]
FSAYDTAGNKGTVTRTVIVSADPNAPIITLAGNSEIDHEAGTVFQDPGATVADKDGNALDASKIEVTGKVRTDSPGQHVLMYDFSDESGRNAMQIKRKVNVADTLAPEITINGEKDMRIGLNTEFNDPGASVTDIFDDNVQLTVVIPVPVDTTAPGKYEIIYRATDDTGNKTEIIRTVRVLADIIPPVITLIGEATVTVKLGADYDDEGTVAEDDVDGVLTPFIEDSGTVDAVDTSKEGTYVITYDVEDFSGNK